jgi:hypothetical protein
MAWLGAGQVALWRPAGTDPHRPGPGRHQSRDRRLPTLTPLHQPRSARQRNSPSPVA